MANMETMIDLVRDTLDGDDWKYEYDDARKLIRTGVSLNCKLQSVKIIIHFNEGGYTTLATAPMKADEQYRASVAEYITRANYGLKNGNFEMDFSDGELRYKVYTNYKGLNMLSKEVILDSIMIPPLMFERYGDGLAALLFGFSDAKTEIEKVEKK